MQVLVFSMNTNNAFVVFVLGIMGAYHTMFTHRSDGQESKAVLASTEADTTAGSDGGGIALLEAIEVKKLSLVEAVSDHSESDKAVVQMKKAETAKKQAEGNEEAVSAINTQVDADKDASLAEQHINVETLTQQIKQLAEKSVATIKKIEILIGTGNKKNVDAALAQLREESAL